jgi:hypothetical protein
VDRSTACCAYLRWSRFEEWTGVAPYSEEFVDCLADVGQYVHDSYGKYTFTTMVLSGFVRAVHLTTGFYDAHYQPGAYLETQARHLERWHGDGVA